MSLFLKKNFLEIGIFPQNQKNSVNNFIFLRIKIEAHIKICSMAWLC